MEKKKRAPTVLLVVLVVIIIAALCDDSDDSADSVVISAECRKAFRAAAAVDEMRDTHRDLFPAYSACTSLEEWKNADTMFPDAIDGVDPISYARNVCAGNQAELGSTTICKAVNAPPPARKSSLIASDSTGLLGVPLPRGAELTEEEPGDPASGIDPKEHYSITASSKDIADFFTRELPAQGWFKSGTSTDTYLFFDKGAYMIGILIKADGGSFTLMGS